ncbi:MAG: cellulase family glycosylhydrolase [Chloroflexota bacterium]|nr:cellulase family glycosylhydrolase [Chloroflexota bacterium]
MHFRFSLRPHAAFAKAFSILLAGALLLIASPAPPPALADEGQTTGPHTLYLPTVSKRCSFSAASASIFGVQMYGATGAGTTYHSALIDSGAEWVRVPIEWDAVEPTNLQPANYRWQSADAAVAAASASCKNLIVTLRSAPSWAATYPNSRIKLDQLGEFAQFVRATVERYDGDGINDAPGSPVVTYWELYNEPDASFDFVPEDWHRGWGEFGAEYAQMLSVAYPAIKQANPKAQVLFGGIAYDNFVDDGGNFIEEFLDDVLAAGGGAHFDIMNIHSYPAFGGYWVRRMDPSCVKNGTCFGPGVVEKVTYVHDKLGDYGLTKPIMITESGWHSDNPPDQPSSPEMQARYVLEIFTQSKAAGVLNTIYFALTDPGGGYPHENGLVSASTPPQRKPAFTAYQVAVDWLAPARFVRRLPAAELKAKAMDAYQFFHPSRGHTFYVAWLNPAKLGLDLDGNGTLEENKGEVKDNQETIRLPGTTANVYNIYGTLLETVNSNDGNVRILIGGQPRIIEIVK